LYESSVVGTGARGPYRINRRIEIAIEAAVANPPVNRVAADVQLARQRALARALLQVQSLRPRLMVPNEPQSDDL